MTPDTSIRPRERREDYQHIKATAGKLASVAAIFAFIGATATWFGVQIISPGANVKAVVESVQAVKDTLGQRISILEDDHVPMRRYVGWLVVSECEKMTGPQKRNMAALGFSCADVVNDLRAGR